MADIIAFEAHRPRPRAAALPAEQSIARLAAAQRLMRDAIAEQRATVAQLARECRHLQDTGWADLHAGLAACAPALAALRQHGADGREVVRIIETGDIDACIALRDRLVAARSPSDPP